MLELQDVWKPSESDVHYSTRRAATALNAGMGTASRAFHELADHGFIERVGASDWLNGKARTYRLTWLSHDGREPTNEWVSWREKLNKGFHHSNGQGLNRSTSVTVTQKRTNSLTKNQQVSDDVHTETVPPQIHH
jgi:DNA-binding transcriptional MocR family regulator